jgi:hypothetical protein
MGWKVPSDPFISHMRIAYEDNIRNSTEEYWRKRIAKEIRSYPIPSLNNVDILYSQEVLKKSIADFVESKLLEE